MCIKLLLLLFLAFSVLSIEAQNFITKWYFPSASANVIFNTHTTAGGVNYTWSCSPSGNNGASSFTVTSAGACTLSVTISAGDTLTLSMEPTNLRLFYISNGTHRLRLIDVTQWGDVPWTNMQNAFWGCSNLNITATDLPNFSSVSNMTAMFRACSALNGPSNIGDWNMSTVTNMYRMFNLATSFNQNIGDWNVSNVTDMNEMFYQASAFNNGGLATINNWNTSKVTSFSNMFRQASVFNQPIGAWNTSSVNFMHYMFYQATSFNQNIGSWNTSNVTSMSNFFYQATAFNQDIGSWDIQNVSDLTNMFYGAFLFNQDIGGWNTSSVTLVSGMFYNAANFNQNLGAWNIENIINFSSMLSSCAMSVENYDNTLIGWSTQSLQSGRTIDCIGRRYCNAKDARQSIINTYGWTINGDAEVGGVPYLLAAGNSISSLLNCNYKYYNLSNISQRFLFIDPNGNTINPTTVSVNNNSIGALPPGVTSNANGYYQATGSGHTFRISRRLTSIEAPGTYSANGGVIVRVYYNATEHINMTNNAFPAGTLQYSGWFKSNYHTAAEVVADISSTDLPSGVHLEPIATGTEGGIAYAEFQLTTFSTIGFYAKTTMHPLPIELTEFTATPKINYIQLNWQTATEINNAYFTLQKSPNGSTWEPMAQIPGAGNSTQKQDYVYYDESPYQGDNYYRLSQTDYDGTQTSFNIVHTLYKPQRAENLKLYPNPAQNSLNLELPEQQNIYETEGFYIYNTMGELKQWILPNTEDNTQPIDIQHLTPGVYVLQYGEQRISFVKQ